MLGNKIYTLCEILNNLALYALYYKNNLRQIFRNVNGLSWGPLSFLTRFLTSVSPCNPVYGILQ